MNASTLVTAALVAPLVLFTIHQAQIADDGDPWAPAKETASVDARKWPDSMINLHKQLTQSEDMEKVLASIEMWPAQAPTRFDGLKVGGEAMTEANSGSVKITTVLDGKRPFQAGEELKANCGEPRAGRLYIPPNTEVNEDMTVPWVFVHVTGGLDASQVQMGPVEPAVLDQRGCEYRPHVLGMVRGQELWVQNSEAVEGHNVKYSPANSEGGNESQKARTTLVLGFNPEMAIGLRCEMHSWMSAKVHVLNHPYFATTHNAVVADKVEYRPAVIQRLKPGKYTLTVWHETFKGKQVEVEVKAGQTTELTIKLTQQ